MEWLKANWFKLSIVLMVFGIGISIVYYFLVYIPNKNELRRLDDLAEQEQAQKAKSDQDKRDYIAKRKKDCFDIYDKEKTNWSNTKGSEYDADKDVCYVIYNAVQGEWKGIKCDSLMPSDKVEVGTWLWNYQWQRYSDCSDKQFRKEF